MQRYTCAIPAVSSLTSLLVSLSHSTFLCFTLTVLDFDSPSSLMSSLVSSTPTHTPSRPFMSTYKQTISMILNSSPKGVCRPRTLESPTRDTLLPMKAPSSTLSINFSSEDVGCSSSNAMSCFKQVKCLD